MNWFSTEPRTAPTRGTSLPPRLEPLEDRALLATAPVGFVNGMLFSPSHFDRLITDNYQKILDRAPAPTEVAAWRAQLQAGLSRERLDALFAASAENLADFGGPSFAWVQSLYRDFLGREGETPGVAHHFNRLIAGASPLDVALSIVGSAERYRNAITEHYLRFLGRAPEPGALAAQLNHVLTRGLDLQELTGAFLASAEFAFLGGDSATGIISRTFLTLLGRGASLTDLNTWLPFFPPER